MASVPEPAVGNDEWVTSPDERFRACFTDIGEGLCGDYDDTDPDDEPRLRLDVQTRDVDASFAEDPVSAGTDDPGDPDHGWYWVRDGSYCTNVHADQVTGAQRHRLLTRVLVDIDGETGSVKCQLEEASWMRADSADTPA